MWLIDSSQLKYDLLLLVSACIVAVVAFSLESYERSAESRVGSDSLAMKDLKEKDMRHADVYGIE